MNQVDFGRQTDRFTKRKDGLKISSCACLKKVSTQLYLENQLMNKFDFCQIVKDLYNVKFGS